MYERERERERESVPQPLEDGYLGNRDMQRDDLLTPYTLLFLFLVSLDPWSFGSTGPRFHGSFFSSSLLTDDGCFDACGD